MSQEFFVGSNTLVASQKACQIVLKFIPICFQEQLLLAGTRYLDRPLVMEHVIDHLVNSTILNPFTRRGTDPLLSESTVIIIVIMQRPPDESCCMIMQKRFWCFL